MLPQQSTSHNSNKCFTWFESGDTGRGQGEAASIAAMVGYAARTYAIDPSRVFVTGLSAGGAMSAVMLAAYPDVFRAGSIDAGLPYRCATSVAQAYSCMNPGVDKTPQAWGDLVRGAYAGYTGPRPRVAIWQGQSDTTVAPRNGVELRDQFTDALGVGQSPTATGTLGTSTSWEAYGPNAVRLYRIAGMGHGTPVDPGTGPQQWGTAAAYFLDTVCAAYHDVVFFGPRPTTPTCRPAGPTSPAATPLPSARTRTWGSTTPTTRPR